MSYVIIVDDQKVNRSVYARMAALLANDVNVETFADPREALVTMRENVPDLIVTDYRMPSMNGAAFIKQVRKERELAEVPIIVITVYDDKAYRLRALDAGATDFLLSPVDYREFVARARNQLNLRKQQVLLAAQARQLQRKLEQTERSLQEAVRDSSERLAQVIDSVPALISAADATGRFLFANECHATLFGIDKSSLVGRDPSGLFSKEGYARRNALDELVLRTGKPAHTFQEELIDQSGQRRVFLTSKSPLNDALNKTYGVVTSAIEITDLKIAHDRLQFLANHDSLTGLPNRIRLSDEVAREIARSRRGDRRLALYIIDLDGFKEINDLQGHSGGDQLLVAVSKRLKTLESNGCLVARLGGDEFAVLQRDLPSGDAAVLLSEGICQLIRDPFTIADESVSITASVGVAQYPVDGQKIDELLRHADLAMYEAKMKGRDRHQIYAPTRKIRSSAASALDSELHAAIESDEFVLHYQPQVSLSTGRVRGTEALLRWQRADGRLLLPAEFLPRAEESGLIRTINECVLRRACNQIAAWRRAAQPQIRVAINLSPIQFRSQMLPLLVARVLSETGLEPSLIELEITENFLMHDVEQTAAQLRQLRELGTSISIDDFGTGFSSLNYLKHLPIDRLKIDQSFVHDLTTDPSDRTIVATIINLAHSLSMEVVAEGVETAEQFAWLRTARCDEAQGFYCGKPMPAEEFWSCLAPSAQASSF